MNLLITGVSGHLGQVVVRQLMKNNPFTRTVGIDRVRPTVLGPAHFVEADLRKIDIGELLIINDIQVVLHLASVRGQAGIELDQDMVRLMLEVVEPAGIKRIVVPSRNWVYHRGDGPSTEQTPLRTSSIKGVGIEARSRFRAAWQGLAAVEAKLLVEDALASYRAESPDVEVVIPRLCTVIGTEWNRSVDAILSSRWLFGPTDYEPSFQFLNLEDAGAMLVRCASLDGLNGAYNLAGSDTMKLSTVAGVLEKKLLRLPRPIIRAVVSGLSRIGLLDFTFSDLVRVQYGTTMCTAKSTEVLGEPRLTSRQTLALWRTGS